MPRYKATGAGIRGTTFLITGRGRARRRGTSGDSGRCLCPAGEEPAEGSLTYPPEDGPAMNLDRDRHAEAERHPLGAEAAIARYYRDVLLGRALPPDDHL